MMQRHSGDFLNASTGCGRLAPGRVWPVSVEQALVCANGDGSRRGEVVDAGQMSGAGARIPLEPPVSITRRLQAILYSMP
jgi:hypothetical protein